MKLSPTAVGAEPKKLALLGAIIVFGVAIYWYQNRSDSSAGTVSASVTSPHVAPASGQPAAGQPAAAPSAAIHPVNSQSRRTPGVSGASAGMEDFNPTLKVKDDVDLSQVDPRIRLDLLTKLRAEPLEGGSSSLFEFSKPPEPPAPKVEAINPGPVPVPPPAPPKVTTPVKSGPPPSPPIPFKYYGYAGKSADGQLQEGFFLEGDPNTGEPIRKREGDIVKDRYKIVRIGVRQAVVEDTVSHEEKTLQLLEEPQ